MGSREAIIFGVSLSVGDSAVMLPGKADVGFGYHCSETKGDASTVPPVAFYLDAFNFYCLLFI